MPDKQTSNDLDLTNLWAKDPELLTSEDIDTIVKFYRLKAAEFAELEKKGDSIRGAAKGKKPEVVEPENTGDPLDFLNTKSSDVKGKRR